MVARLDHHDAFGRHRLGGVYLVWLDLDDLADVRYDTGTSRTNEVLVSLRHYVRGALYLNDD